MRIWVQPFYLYILANYRHGTLYVGTTNSIDERTDQHRTHYNPKSFSARYKLYNVVHLEEFQYINDARRREDLIKRWKRSWKFQLIEKDNPNWDNLIPWTPSQLAYHRKLK